MEYPGLSVLLAKISIALGSAHFEGPVDAMEGWTWLTAELVVFFFLSYNYFF